MKKFTSMLTLILCSILLVNAQTFEDKPIDPQLRFGKLENGLTYYIRHNVYPENRADFYIAQRVGSMQEEDSQRGLAHFLEHMAFNGTKHFRGRKTMTSYLETLGAKFGANVNAYTAFDETVYNLSNIPVLRETVIDSCLLVLHDWSGYIELEDEAVDKERLIIKEEWRTRNNSGIRIFEKQLPAMYPNSKYAYRSPIGLMEVVENFDYQTLKDYYHKWYRPNLQAIIVVGDIDVDKIEAKIKTLFSKIPMPENAAKRIYEPVADNKEPLISIATDKESTSAGIAIYMKHDIYTDEVRKSTESFYRDILNSMTTSMINSRFAEICQKANSPIVGGGAYIGTYFVSKSKNAFVSVATPKEGKELESLTVLVQENERIKRFGFIDSELDRAKINYFKSIENAFNNRKTKRNGQYVNEYVRAFCDDKISTGSEYYFEIMKKMLPTITLATINEYAKSLITEDNMVVSITGPEKDGLIYPTQSEVLATLEKERQTELTAYIDSASDEPLIKELPKAGKIIKIEKNEALSSTLWTLSNGIKVAYKNTDFKEDEISMSGSAYGGISNLDIKDKHVASLATGLPEISGLGNFDAINLKKKLTGKRASVSVGAGMWEVFMSGSSNKEGLETMMQLAYLHFTAPRTDAEAFSTRMDYVRTQILNSKKVPKSAFGDSTTVAIYKNNPWVKSMEVEDLDNIKLDRVLEIYKELYANPGAFTFTLVGTIDEAVLKPLVEQYLASLPSGNKNATYTKIDVTKRTGKYENIFEQQMESPNATNLNLYSGFLKYDSKNKIHLDVLKQVLNIVYYRSIREDEGGTYGVGVGASIGRIPEGDTQLQMRYDTNPEKSETINAIIDRELQKLIQEGPQAEDLQKVKEYMLKKHQEDIKQNWYWGSMLSGYYKYGEDNFSNKLAILESFTADDIKNIAKELVSQDNLIKVMMFPKK